MPGLVKVGKTTRTPSERAQELSSVSGLPTPFIVVFEQMFVDCSVAESYVHTVLAGKGFRVADNREFFNAPVNEVVRAILSTPGLINDVQVISPSSDNETQDRNKIYPWDAALREAISYLVGYGDYIKDEEEAIRYFHAAAKLGSLEVYSILGDYYEDRARDAAEDSLESDDSEEYEETDFSKAFSYYKDGAKKGNSYCYWRMGLLYWKDVEIENAQKCFSMFAKTFLNKSQFDQPAIVVEWSKLDDELHEYLLDAFADFVRFHLLPDSLNPVLLHRKEALCALAEKALKDHEHFGFGEEVVESLHSANRKIINHLNQISSV